ncbi:nickel ABC transporter, nickel/metallophore periplasmic binding protein [Clostridium sp. 'deep sea']|uniref:nickel ABC transporter substrate-binding protein n=1 Tax=Clostridium sp. 'deep sea' TaxID=2779445 RepID=UPI0018964682|nr:nickel ABC transporter substrate-binding protein [Clostridium sp. 'deep sea']QOR34644.1 nickel ABC transporter, nickel/metallophore periplasmic binding protein [Clostridium sp. 'deep sea']
MMLTLVAGCSNTHSRDISQVGAGKLKEITLCESWRFEKGFPTVITPENSTNQGIAYYLGNFYETLVNSENGKIVQGLAKSWSVSKDGLVYTFGLKKGVKFSDGADFNAEVVKKNLEMIPKLLGKYNGSFGLVTTLFKEVKVIDEYTVKVYLSSPYYGALQDFAMLNPMSIMSPNAFNEDGTLSDKLLTSTMGTGPYMFYDETNGNMYTFIRNKYYWGEKPEVDKFNIKVIPDNQSKALALRSGEIDMIFGSRKISYNTFKEFSDNKCYIAKKSNSPFMTRYLGFNLTEDPFNDKNVRLAISHAIDKQNICDNLLYGIDTKADTLLSTSWTYCDVEIQPYEYNIEKAKKILEDSGWKDSDQDGIREKDGKKLEGEIIYKTGNATVDEIVLLIESYLKKIGMNIKIKGFDFLSRIAEIQKGNFSMAYEETYGIPYDPFTFVVNMNSDIAKNIPAQGLAHIKDSNKIIMELSSLVDENEVQDKYKFILNEIHKNVSFVPISYKKELVIFNSEKIADYEYNGQPSNVDISGVKFKINQ